MSARIHKIKRVTSYIVFLIGLLLVVGTIGSVDLDIITLYDMFIYWVSGAILMLTGYIGLVGGK